MRNKAALMNLVARAEEGRLLPGEAQILRDAIELLDDLAMTLDKLMGRAAPLIHPGYEASDTASFRAIRDDESPGRP